MSVRPGGLPGDRQRIEPGFEAFHHLPGTVLAAADRDQAVVAAAADLALATTASNARFRASQSICFLVPCDLHALQTPSGPITRLGRVSGRMQWLQ